MEYILARKDNEQQIMVGTFDASPQKNGMVWPVSQILPEEVFTVELSAEKHRRTLTPLTVCREEGRYAISAGDYQLTQDVQDTVKQFGHLIEEGERVTHGEFANLIDIHYSSAAALAVSARLRSTPRKDSTPMYALQSVCPDGQIREDATLRIPVFTFDMVQHLRDVGEMDDYVAISLDRFKERYGSQFERSARGFVKLYTMFEPEVVMSLNNIARSHLAYAKKVEMIDGLLAEEGYPKLNKDDMLSVINCHAETLKIQEGDLTSKLATPNRAVRDYEMAKHVIQHNTENAFSRVGKVVLSLVKHAQAPEKEALLLAAGLKVHLQAVAPGSGGLSYFEKLMQSTNELVYAPANEALDTRVQNTLDKAGYPTDADKLALATRTLVVSPAEIKRIPNMGEYGYNALQQWAQQRVAVNELQLASQRITQSSDRTKPAEQDVAKMLSSLQSVVETLGQTAEQRTALAVKYAMDSVKTWTDDDLANYFYVALYNAPAQEGIPNPDNSPAPASPKRTR